MCCVPTARRVATKKLTLLKAANNGISGATYKSNRAAIACSEGLNLIHSQVSNHPGFTSGSSAAQLETSDASNSSSPLTKLQIGSQPNEHFVAQQDEKRSLTTEPHPVSEPPQAIKSAPVELAKKKRKRIRKKLKPGLTAKNQERQFVKHDYHDHANDDPELYKKSTVCSERSKNSNHSALDPFPFKLHTLLDQIESDGHAEVISWQPHGRAFVIHQKQAFVERIMPKYFKQTKLTSFQRQLNLYGYTRISRGTDAGGYYHELFLRGMPHLCYNMVRIKCKGTGFKAASDPDTEPNFYKMPFVLHRTFRTSTVEIDQKKPSNPICVTSDDESSNWNSLTDVEPYNSDFSILKVDFQKSESISQTPKDNEITLLPNDFSKVQELSSYSDHIFYGSSRPPLELSDTSIFFGGNEFFSSIQSFDVDEETVTPPAYDYFSNPDQVPSLEKIAEVTLASDYDWVGFSCFQNVGNTEMEQAKSTDDDEAIFEKILSMGSCIEDDLIAKLENNDADDDEALGHLLDMIVE